MKATTFKETLANLFTLLIWSDGVVNEKEIAYGIKMAEIVGMDESMIASRIRTSEVKATPELLESTIKEMKSLTREEQILGIAWMCVIANADGFMDRTEWQLIYRIYYKELCLTLEEVMNQQKVLNKTVLRADAKREMAYIL